MAERPKAQRQKAREARLQAALRENLVRRKAQARGRASAEGSTAAASDQGGEQEAAGKDEP